MTKTINEPLTKESVVALLRSKVERKIGHKRLIGLEPEIPLVYDGSNGNELGSAVSVESYQKLLRTLAQEGVWREQYDDRSVDQAGNAQLVGLVHRENEGLAVTCDFGACTLELNLPPETTLGKAEEGIKDILRKIVPAAQECGIVLLGYGIQPVSLPSRSLMAPKSRYAALSRRFYTREHHDTSPDGDVYFHSINAAEQVHIDPLNEQEAVRMVNLYNGLAPVLIALFSNSQVWGNTVDRRREPRELFWDRVVNIPEDMHRKGIAPSVSSLDDYVDLVLGYQPILTKRDGNYWEFSGKKSMRKYLERGIAQGVVPGSSENDTKIDLLPEPVDLYALLGTVWHEARLTGYGTVEVRSPANQPLDSITSVAALVLGLSIKQEEAEKLLEKYGAWKDKGGRYEVLQQARLSAIWNGLQGNMGNVSLLRIADEMVQLADDGLRGIGEESKHLDALRNRINYEKNPSDIVVDVYQRGGIRAVVDHTKIRMENLK